MTEPIATSLSLNGQNKKIRTLSTTTVGASAPQLGESTSRFTDDSIPADFTKWFEFVAPPDTPGIVRLEFQHPRAGDDPDIELAWVHYLQYGSGFSGLGQLEWSVNDIVQPPSGLTLNCEGYQTGHEDAAFERAIAPGEHHYLQVTTYGPYPHVNVGINFTIQWYFEPLPQPYEFTATPSIKQCAGTPYPGRFNTGYEIRYYLADTGGWPAKFLPGKSTPHSPDLPIDGHAFYVEEWIEAMNVHYRGFIVGWTEESGPWFYSHLNPDSSMRTWDVETIAAEGIGACGPDGIHHVPYFADRPIPPGVGSGFGYELDSFHSTVAEGETPTTNWGDHTGARDLIWGGPARPDRFFADFGSLVREFDLDGNEVRDISGLPVPITPLWCGLDGHTMFAFTPNFGFGSGGDLYSFDLNDDSLSLVASAVFTGPNFPNILGIRSNGELVVTQVFPGDVALVDSETGSVRRTFTLPPHPYTAFYGSSARWNYLGVTSDSKHLFLSAIGPLDIMPFGRGRRFVSDIYWIDLDTGAGEFKFRMGHPFHDTVGIVDTINTPQTTVPVDLNIRLKPTIPKVVQIAGQGVTEMTPR